MTDERAQRPRLIIGFDLGLRQRACVGLLGLAILAFDFYQWHSDGASTLALAALIFAALLLLIGLGGFHGIGRMTFDRGAMRMSLEPPEGTGRAQAEEPPATTSVPKEPVQQDGGKEVPDTLPGSDAAELGLDSPLRQAADAYEERDYAQFDKLMQEAVSQAPEEARVGLASLRLQWLYQAGQADKLEQLEALRGAHATSPEPVRALGQCYDWAGEHATAAKLYAEGYEIEGLSEDERLTFLAEQATALRYAKRFEEAEGLLTKEFQRVDGGKGQAELHKYLAQLYEAWDKKDQMQWHLEKVLEANPGDAATRFRLAYSYAQNDHPHAAFYHYDVIQSVDPGASNNIAIILDEFEMPITSAVCYRRAAAQKNTLAAANLARTMILAGLADEAKHLLDEALKEPEPDEAVHRAASQLVLNKEKEGKRLGEVREAAEAERQLLRDRVDAERRSAGAIKADDIVGRWKTPVGIMTFEMNEGRLMARYRDDYWDWVATGAVKGRTYSFNWKCDRPGKNDEGTGFFLFASDDRFEGLIRHWPQKGDAMPVSGSDRDPRATRTAPEEGIAGKPPSLRVPRLE